MALSKMEQELAARKRDTAYLGTLNRKADFMEKEQAALDRQGDAFLSARQRRLASQNMTALTDPGRYAPQVYKQAKQWHDQGGLRAHELDMLKQQGENEFKIAEQKRLGMREQGADAAGHNAEATKYGWDKQLEVEQERQKGLTEREKMIGERTERIAGMEHGTIGPDGKVTPGSRERVANINADSAYDVADRQGQTAVAVEREKGTQMAAANIREEQVLRWKQQHEKELAQMRLNNMIPDEREMRGLIILQQQPENKGKTIAQVLQELRKAQQQ